MRLTRRNGDAAVDFVATLAAIRDELAAVDVEIAKVSGARCSREEAMERIDSALANAAAGGWNWQARANEFSRAQPPMRPRAAVAPAEDARPWEIASWLIATLGDVIRERLVSALPDDPDALSTAERTKRLAELTARRLDLEREEERTVLRAEAVGLRLDRRGDLTPAVYLETVV